MRRKPDTVVEHPGTSPQTPPCGSSADAGASTSESLPRRLRHGRSEHDVAGARLSDADRALLDFIAKLAVEDALRETGVRSSVAACASPRSREGSENDGDA